MIGKAILLGRIGKKETKITKNNSEMTVLSIATDKTYTDSNGERQKQTTWHHVQAFNKISDILGKYTEVGNIVYIEGTIQNRKVTQEGIDKWMYSVIANEVKLLPQADKNSSSRQQNTSNDNFVDDGIPF